MPKLWIHDLDTGRWDPQQLPDAPSQVQLEALLAGSPAAHSDAGPVATLVSYSDGSATGLHLLLTSQGSRVRVNGAAVRTGIKLLEDRDSILTGSVPPVFFTTQRQPVVEPFPGSDHPVFCPRDKSELTAGAPAVGCPGCQTWYHEDGERPCWSFSAQCAICGYPTAMDGDFLWTPEEL